MCTCKFLTACVLLGVAAAAALAQPGDKLPILDTFQGTVANHKKPELKTGFIATEADWKQVWAKVNSKEKLPAVDFAKHFLLVSTQDAADPNHRSASVLKDDKGVVTVIETSTLIGFTPSDQTIYRFYKVSREGVTGMRRFDPAQKKAVIDPLPNERATQPEAPCRAGPNKGQAPVRPREVAARMGKCHQTGDTGGSGDAGSGCCR